MHTVQKGHSMHLLFSNLEENIHFSKTFQFNCMIAEETTDITVNTFIVKMVLRISISIIWEFISIKYFDVGALLFIIFVYSHRRKYLKVNSRDSQPSFKMAFFISPGDGGISQGYANFKKLV